MSHMKQNTFTNTLDLVDEWIRSESEKMEARMKTILEEMQQADSLDELTMLERAYDEVLTCHASLKHFELQFIQTSTEESITYQMQREFEERDHRIQEKLQKREEAI